jgi:hypothetical protein
MTRKRSVKTGEIQACRIVRANPGQYAINVYRDICYIYAPMKFLMQLLRGGSIHLKMGTSRLKMSVILVENVS